MSMRWVVLALCLAARAASAESELSVGEYGKRAALEAAVEKRVEQAKARKKKDAVELGEELVKTIGATGEKEWPAKKAAIAKLVKQFVDASSVSVQLVSLSSKKIEMYVNGKQLKAGQSVTVDAAIELRAMIVDDKRELARKVVHGAAKEVVAASDYALVIRTGDKSQDWRVASEKYEWKPGGKTKSSSIAVDDVVEVEDSVKGSVTASIEWKGPATDSDTETATYEIKIK